MSNQFSTNQDMWTASGDKVLYVGTSLGQHIVRAIFEHDPDREPSFGDPYLIMESQLFTEEPTVETSPQAQRLAADITQLKIDRENLQKEVSKLNTEKRAFESAKSKIEIYGDVVNAIDLLEGRITHIVEHGNNYWGPNIKSVDDIGNGSYDDQYHAVYLSFDRNTKKFNWIAKQGRGYDQMVTPCKSYEEAKEVAQKIFTPEFARAKHQSRLEDVDKLIRRADLIGMVIPEDVATHREQLAQVEAAKDREAAQVQLQELQKKLGVIA